jgi:opacity protein-like surface antigen
MRRAAFLIALLASSAAPVRADSVRMRPFLAGNRSLGLQLGPARPTAPAFKDMVRTGAAVNVHGLHYVYDWIAVGADLGYYRFFKGNFASQAMVSGVPASNALNSEAQAIAALALVRINFFERGIWSPYVLGGAGLHRFEQTVSASVLTNGQPAEETVVANATGIAVTAGTGIEVFLVRDASVSFEARFHQFRLDRKKFANNAESLSFLFGFHFWWGRNW